MSGIVASLVGPWRLHKAFDNGASMVGAATILSRGDGGFDFCEQGRLRLASGQVLDAERRYVFEEQDRGFLVLFMETPLRLFHRVILNRIGSTLVGHAIHHCGADRYDSRYTFCGNGCFTIEHTARGPRKSYVSRSHYAREATV